uniref:Uncharacterized protein n=1 Tax=Anguilla anguilla TaxID=7936 RepID=A0A0E9PBT0_ANGAN
MLQETVIRKLSAKMSWETCQRRVPAHFSGKKIAD